MATATKKRKYRIEEGCFPSSPARRDAAKEKVQLLKLEEERLRAEIKAFADTVTPLVKMAQFVVDVDGDPTAVARLKEALQQHMVKEEAGRRLQQVLKDLREARSAAMYFRYKAGTLDTSVGIGLFFVEGQGDTRAEAIATAESKA